MTTSAATESHDSVTPQDGAGPEVQEKTAETRQDESPGETVAGEDEEETPPKKKDGRLKRLLTKAGLDMTTLLLMFKCACCSSLVLPTLLSRA